MDLQNMSIFLELGFWGKVRILNYTLNFRNVLKLTIWTM